PVRAEAPRQAQAENPPRHALAPLLGSTPSAQRPATSPPGHTAQVERGPLAPAQPDALSGQPGRPRSEPPRAQQPQQQSRTSPPPRGEGPTAIQQSIARIHEACQAPTLSPPDYRALFDVMAQEISANGLAGSQTLANIVKRAQDFGIEIRRDDARFVLDVVSEADPWFDQGASASLFASRFRNFVVARCRSQGLNLSAGELDLIEAWFAGPTPESQRSTTAPSYAPGQAPAPRQPAPTVEAASAEMRSDQSWSRAESGQRAADPDMPGSGDMDEFPRIIRTRLRG
ncbi:MAG: NYN domain-containing protein, partial [Hyphomicrobiaceae bacterium]|nr:NYN domain-containing protein [Hyphomicrobiaceae bacterium]